MIVDHYGVRDIAKDWFISYLYIRKQHVTIDTYKSDDSYITYDRCPLILGPLIFLIYSNVLVFAAHCLTFIFLPTILIGSVLIVVCGLVCSDQLTHFFDPPMLLPPHFHPRMRTLFNLSQEGGLLQPPPPFQIFPVAISAFLLRLPFGQFTHPLSKYIPMYL